MLLRRHAVFAGIIATFVIGNANAESKRGPAHTQQHPVQIPSANPAQPRTPDQRGTDQIPLQIKIIPGEPTKEQAEREEYERREKSGHCSDNSMLTPTTRLPATA
jgi:hypothetical protein